MIDTLAVDFAHTLVPEAYPAFDLNLRDANGGNLTDHLCFDYTNLDVFAGDESGLVAPYDSVPESQMAWVASRNIADWYYDNLGRRSYDDDDKQLKMYLDAGVSNASYSTRCDAIQFKFGWVGLDIVRHEFTHAVIRHSFSNLVYEGQSGALNESYADTLAQFADPDDDWLLGEDTLNGQGPIRSLRDPFGYDCGPNANEFCGDPDHIDLYCTTLSCNNDNGGVHTNSGIPNKAHYLISEGGDHKGFTSAGIGNTKAERLIYRVMQILPSRADFEMAAAVTSGMAELFMMYFSSLSTRNDTPRAWLDE